MSSNSGSAVHDVYAGFVLTVIQLHKHLVQCAAHISEDNKGMYSSMLVSLLCSLNQLPLLHDIEDKHGQHLHDLPAATMRRAAEHVLATMGPPPELGEEQLESLSC